MKSIAVYCSSSNKVDDIYKDEAEKVGNLIAQMGIKLIYGGGNMGLMGILSNSAINSGGDVYGVITNHLIKKTSCSLISSGTERMLLEFSKGNIFQKIKSQPEKVAQVISKLKLKVITKK